MITSNILTEKAIAKAIEAYDSWIEGTDFDDISIEEAELGDAVEAYDDIINNTDFD